MSYIIKFFIDQYKVFNLLSIFVIAFGAYYFLDGQKELFPNLSFGNIKITANYPGLSAEEVEKTITRKIEDEIKNIEGKNELYSISSEGRALVYFDIDPNTKLSNNKIFNDVTEAINRVTVQLPPGIDDPIVKESTYNNSIQMLQLNVTGGKIDELKEIIDLLYDEISKVKGVSLLTKRGYPERQIWVEVDPKKLKKYDLGITEISRAIKKNNLSLSSGSVTINNEEYLIKTLSKIKNLDDIKKIIVRSNDVGNVVRIKDLAKVSFELEELKIKERIKGKQAINLIVYKNSSGDIIKISNKIKEIVKEFKEKKLIPQHIHIAYGNDNSFYVKRRLNVLSQNATLGLLLAFICLIIFFDFRITFWTIVGIPFSFCLAIIIAYNLGITLNIVSMLGFIIVSGMLVDDAIIISENICQKQEAGLPPYEAAIAGTKEMIKPIFAIVATSIIAFLPLAFLPGQIGKILGILPIVVIISLSSSFIECIVVLPGHLAHSISAKKALKNSQKKEKRKWFSVVQKKYSKIILLFLQNPYKVFGGMTVLIFTLGLLAAKNTNFVLFQGSVDTARIHITFSEENSIEDTIKEIDIIEETLRKSKADSYVYEYASRAGEHIVQKASKKKNNLGLVIVRFDPTKYDYVDKALKIMEQELDKLDFVKKHEFQEHKVGPPSGPTISVSVYGSSISKIKKVSLDLMDFLKKTPNVKNVLSNDSDGQKELNVIVDQSLASIYKIGALSISEAMINAFSTTRKINVNTIENNPLDMDIIVKYPQEKTKNINKNLRIVNSVLAKTDLGFNVPINKFTKIEKVETINKIYKLDGRISIEVFATLKDEKNKEYSGKVIRNLLRKKMEEISAQNPDISYSFGGEEKNSKEQITASIKALCIALFGIYLVLVATFRSFVQPLIIVSILPFVVMGVSMGLFVHQIPSGLMPFLGTIALMGIVVNDSLVMVDAINNLRKSGMIKIDAIVQGARSRLRPIITTSLTTVVGVAPLAYSFFGSEPFLVPMAITLFSGIIFSTFFLIFVFPMIYLIIENISEGSISKFNAIISKFSKENYSD